MSTTFLPALIDKINLLPSGNKIIRPVFMGCSLFATIFFANLLFCQQIFSQTVVLNPATPFIVPAGVVSVKAECRGTGGSGGGGTGTLSAARSGGGGGGGAYNSGILAVTGGQSIATSVGAAGGAGTGTGGAGGATSFGAVVANGGAGGGSNNGLGGAGGINVFAGGNGAAGVASTGGGGGGGAGNNGAGVNGSSPAGGTGGVGTPNAFPYIGGTGGNGSTGGGNAGAVPGGGGGGGRGAAFFGTGNGGAGGAGRVVVTYTCAVYSLDNPTTATSPVCGNSTSQINLNSFAAGLPTGVYTVTYNRSAPNFAAGLTVSMTVTTAGSGSFTTAALANAGTTTITITNLQSGSGIGCSNAITTNNTANVTVNPSPVLFTVSGGGAYCALGAGVSISLSGSENGLNYELFRGASPVATQAGTGSALVFPTNTVAGAYTIVATNPSTSCAASMTGSVTVAVNPVPTLTSVTATPGTICLGSVSTLVATAVIPSTTAAQGSGATNTVPNTTFSTLGPNPLQDYYGGAKQQMLYRVSELTAMGMVAGSRISSLQIQLNTANTGYALSNFRVKLLNTTSTALSTTFLTGASLVFGPANVTPTGSGFNTINFATQFTWDGTSNVVIETSYSNNNTGSSGSTSAVYGTTTFVSTAFYRADNVTAATANTQTTANFTYSARNNIKLTFTIPPAITWNPITDLFTNAGGTTPYVAGTNAATVYSKATATTGYTATATNTVGCTATGAVSVTVNNPPVIVSQPVNEIICENGSISFSVTATGTGITYQWRKGTINLTDGGHIAGSNTATLTFSPVATTDATLNYNVVISGTAPCNPVTSSNVSLTVNTAPTVTCPANVITNTDPGVCTATRTFSAASTGSPAPTVTYFVAGNVIAFPYTFPQGITTVDVLAEGACAPDATCSFTVTVNDSQAPVADIANLPNATGECSVTVSSIPTATDNCVGSVSGTTTDPLTYSTQGTYTITWNYTDGNGNTSSQSQTVIVDDITAPVANVTNLPTATGECSVTVAVVPTATDNCVGTVTGTTTDPLTYNSQGTFTINWSYNDGNGNISTQTQTVIVDDITTPVANVTNLPNATGECSVTVAAAPTATDNCVGTVTGTTTDPLTYNFEGTFTINWSYNDGNGNVSTQTQTVIVDDITSPVANVTNLPNATGECSVTVSAPTATDNCVGSVTGTTTDPLTYNTQGTFTINWSYNDGNGNVSTQTQTVIVDDISAPVANVTNLPDATGECSVTVSAPTATDNCVGSVTGTTTDPVTYNTQGTYTINWSYNDGNGNVSTQVQNVIVDDITAPVADIANLPNATGQCSVTVSSIPTATDNCIGSVSGTTINPLTYSTQGTYTITWNYTDGNGNTSSQSQTVIVNDVTAPVISCPASQTFCSVTGNNYTIPVLSATDNCAIASTIYNISGATVRNGNGNNASGAFNVGVSTIVWTVTDINNNVSSCSTTVSINIPPATPGPIAGPTNGCPYIGTGEQVTYSIAPVAFATGYLWTVPSSVSIVSGQGTTALTVTINSGFNASTNPASRLLKVRALSGCGNSADRLLYLLAQFPSTPGPITGTTDICALLGTMSGATYFVNKVVAATSYIWTTQSGTTSVTHPNGTGVNDTVIVVTFASGFTSSAITVAAVNGCGTSGSVRSFLIPRTSAATPGLISGPTNVCANILPSGTAATYSVAPIAGAASYSWNAPMNSVVTHPNGTGVNDYTITVQFPAGFNNGVVSVSATNGCGTSGVRSLGVSKLNPATPSVIDVIQTQVCPGRQYSYTISGVPANSTSIVWTIPTAQGATFVSQSATSITVSYPATAINGAVTVQSLNNCGSSSIRSTPVKLPACPPERTTIAGGNVQSKGSTQPQTLASEKLTLKVFPNPSVSDFNLQVITAGTEKINVRILDMQGRSFKMITVMPYQRISVGSELKAGSYILEVTQGSYRKTEKLLKF